MEQRLYCIYDFKAEAPVNKIFQAFSTDAEAVRMFTDVVQATGTIIAQHPADFGLLFVGTVNFDTLNIDLNMSSRRVPVTTGDAIVRELERARLAHKEAQDAINEVHRNQLSLLNGTPSQGTPEPSLR